MRKTLSFELRIFALVSLLAGSFALQGQTESTAVWLASGHGYTTGYHPTHIEIAPGFVEGLFSINTGSNAPAYYLTNNQDAIRLYANNTFTVSPVNMTTIAQVEYTFMKTSKPYAGVIPPTEGQYTTGGTPSGAQQVIDVWTCPEDQPTDKPIVITLGASGQRALVQVTVTYIENEGQTVTISYNPNWPNTIGTGQMEPESYIYGATVTVASCNYSCQNHIFDKWNTAADGSGLDYYPGSTFNIYSDITLYAQWYDLNDGLIDVLNPENVNAAIGTNIGYCEWSVTCQTGVSPNIYETVYKGKSFRNENYIQINSQQSTASGIVTSLSHGLAKKVEVIWNESTETGRILNVYGKNIAYDNTPDLYNTSQGTLIGTIEKTQGSQSGVLVINDASINLGDYAFIGLRSEYGALYMDEIRITWTAETHPVILFTPSLIDLDNIIVQNETSTTFTVSQSNLEYDITLSADKGSLEPSTISRNSDPVQVTWTYTPDESDLGSFLATVTATSGEPGESGYCSNSLPINALVIDDSGTTLTEAKNAYLQNGTTAALINLAGDGTPGSQVEVVGQSGNYLWLQDGQSGLLVWGPNAPVFEKGYKFTEGTLMGTFTTYQNDIVELVNFNFQNVEYTTGNTLTAVTASLSDLLSDETHQYEYRFVQLSDSVLVDATDPLHWKVGISSELTMSLTDLYGTDFNTKTAPDAEDWFAVKGLFNRYYSGGSIQVELAPTTLSDIATSKKATAPSFNPVGGLDETHAVTTTSVTITPAENTTFYYLINGSDINQSNTEVVINITETPTNIQAIAKRDFYANSIERTYYYKLPDQTYSVAFSINGAIDPDNTVLVADVLLAGQCPKVDAIGSYILRGWSTSPNSTEVVTLPMQGINNNITLYAVYALPTAYCYNKLTDHTDIEAGQYIILSDDGRGRYYTLKNAYTHSTPVAYLINDLELSIVGNQLVGNDYSEVEWNVSGDNSAEYTITSASNPDLYLYTINSSTGVRIGNDSATWTLTEDLYTNGFFNLESNTTNRFLSLYVSTNNTTIDWRCYTASNIYSNTSHAQLTLFKRTPVFEDNDPRYTRIFVNETATNGITITGPSVIPSAAHLNAPDASHLVMDNYPIVSNNETWFLIEDGASFIPSPNNPTSIKARIQKEIIGYGYDNSVQNGWYLIASPVGTVNANGLQQQSGSKVEGLTTDGNESFDLYLFDQTQSHGEWLNYEANGNSTVFGQFESILYASQHSRTITFSGTLTQSCQEQPLIYSEGATYAGWNLIGNPFTHNAYFYSDNVSDFYKLVETESNGAMISELQPFSASDVAVNPIEGIFVKVTESDQTFSFRSNRRKENTVESLINIKVLNSDGMVIDQARVRFNNGFSLEKYMLNPYNTKICIPQDGKNYAVVNVKGGDETPINFKAAKNGSYSLLIEASDVDLTYLHLIDNLTAADVDLLQEPIYTFDAKRTDYASRFRLVYKTNDSNADNDSFAYYDGSRWVVSNAGKSSLLVIDMMGRVVRNESINGTVFLNLDKLSSGFYLMRLENETETKTQKIVIR